MQIEINYQVTGVDISDGMLAEAEKKAQEGIIVEWVRCDAGQFHSAKPFDTVVCLCEVFKSRSEFFLYLRVLRALPHLVQKDLANSGFR